MQFNEDIPPAPLPSTLKRILTADLLTVKSVANNLRETGQASRGFAIVIYEA